MRTTQNEPVASDEPEAVEKHGAERERDARTQRVEHARPAAEPRRARRRCTIAPDEDVDGLPERTSRTLTSICASTGFVSA